MIKHTALSWMARQLVGVTGSNVSIVDKMRRATDGKAQGEPWCACFVQHCVREVDLFVDELRLPESETPQELPATESTQAMWSQAPPRLRRMDPRVGHVAVWRLKADHSKGHCGIVVGFALDGILTVEGNTSATAGTTEAERNGNGVWQKTRPGGQVPGFELLGYLSPWD